MNDMLPEFKGVYNTSSDKSYLRQSIKKIAKNIGFSEREINDINLALTEIFTNVDKYGGRKADLLASVLERDGKISGLFISVTDYGPGIENIDLAMSDGYTTSPTGSLGLGLGAIYRLMNNVEILSKPFKLYGTHSGTTINMTKYLSSTPKYEPIYEKYNLQTRYSNYSNIGSSNYYKTNSKNQVQFKWDIDARTIMKSGQRVNGDAHLWVEKEDKLTVALIDGLGHGDAANRASCSVVNIIKKNPDLNLVELINEIHKHLLNTIGVQIMLLQIDKKLSRVKYIGIGNIRAFLIKQNSAKSFLSLSGTVGKQIPMLNPSTINIDEKCTIILHTDGVSRSWLPSVRRINYNQFTISEIIDWIMSNYKKKDDDSSVLVIKNF